MSWNTTPHDLQVQAQRSAQRIGNKDGVMAAPSPQQNWGLGSNPNMGSTDNWWRLQGINPHGTPGPSVSHPTGSPTPGNGAGTLPTPPAQDDPEEEEYPEPSQIHPGTLQSGGAQDYPDTGIVPTAYGGTRMNRAIVGDPQADGGPNPELVEASGPIRVTPLKNMPQRRAHASWARLPHYDQGTPDSSAAPFPDSAPPPAPPVFHNTPLFPESSGAPAYPLVSSTDLGGNVPSSSLATGTDQDSFPPTLLPPDLHTDHDSGLAPENRT